MNLSHAQKIAAKIIAELAPFCLSIEVAGSIRRCRPEVNDIDLVIIPRDLAALKARAQQRAVPLTNGSQILSFRLANGVPLEIYLARQEEKDLLQTIPTNWGSILLCRTGSKEHNIWLATRAEALGLQWKTMIGIVDQDGYVIASATEQDIYSALALPFIPPTRREIDYLRNAFPHPLPRGHKVGGSAPTAGPPGCSMCVPPMSGHAHTGDPARNAVAMAELRKWKEETFGPDIACESTPSVPSVL
jgi:DNA polymerase/3'-5' exonuclease PolX